MGLAFFLLLFLSSYKCNHRIFLVLVLKEKSVRESFPSAVTVRKKTLVEVKAVIHPAVEEPVRKLWLVTVMPALGKWNAKKGFSTTSFLLSSFFVYEQSHECHIFVHPCTKGHTLCHSISMKGGISKRQRKWLNSSVLSTLVVVGKDRDRIKILKAQ